MHSAHDAHESTGHSTPASDGRSTTDAPSMVAPSARVSTTTRTRFSQGIPAVDATAGRYHALPEPRAYLQPSISVILPTLNEAKNLPHVFAQLPSDLHEVIVVDGGSTDETSAVARRLRPDVRIIQQARRGKGDALRCGFEAATGEVLVMLDADGSADPAEIPNFVKALIAGHDFAKGSRFREGGGSADITRLRRVGNRCLSATVNILFRTSYSDLCYGYNAFWRHCLPAMKIDCDGFEVETLINIRIARAGLSVSEVPSFERARIHGQSNLNTFRDGGRVLRTIVRERMRRAGAPSHVAAELEALALDGLGVEPSTP